MPGTPDDYIESAIKLTRRGKHAEAVPILREGVHAHPDNSFLLSLLGGALWDLGQSEEAVAALYESVRLNGELECPRLILAENLRELGRIADARAVLEQGMQHCPGRTELWQREIDRLLGVRSLSDTASAGDLQTLAAILDGDSPPTLPEQHEALTWAAYHGRLAVVQFLLDRGLDAEGAAGDPPLVRAAHMGRDRIVQLLLDRGASVNAAADYEYRWTALHSAVGTDIAPGHLRVVRRLLRAGADPQARDRFGRTPLFYVREGQWEIFDALIGAGADVNARDPEGTTPLANAALYGRGSILANLLQHGADPAARDNAGLSALGYLLGSSLLAAHRMAEDLLDAGAVPAREDSVRVLQQLDNYRRHFASVLTPPDE